MTRETQSCPSCKSEILHGVDIRRDVASDGALVWVVSYMCINGHDVLIPYPRDEKVEDK